MQIDPDVTIHIRYYRQTQGLTLRELAADSACSKNYLHQAERQKGDLSIYTLGRIANRLQIPPRLLVIYPQWPVAPPCPCPCHTQTSTLEE